MGVGPGGLTFLHLILKIEWLVQFVGLFSQLQFAWAWCNLLLLVFSVGDDLDTI